MKIETMIDLDGDERITGYYAKGHHDYASFATEVGRQWGATVDGQRVRHEWMRMVPHCTGRMALHTYRECNGRGSFAVTIFDNR